MSIEKKIKKILESSVPFPVKRLYYITEHIALFGYSHKEVIPPEGKKYHILMCVNDRSTATVEHGGEHFSIVGLGNFGGSALESARDFIRKLTLEGNIVILTGSSACFMATWIYMAFIMTYGKHHFLEELINKMLITYPAFNLSSTEIKFLVEKEISKYGEVRSFNKKIKPEPKQVIKEDNKTEHESL